MTRKSFAAGLVLTAALVILLGAACEEDRDLEIGDPPCTGAELAACLETQAELEAISRSSCDGTGRRVCLVPLGQVRPDLVQHLVEHFREEYGLTVIVSTPSAVPSDMVDPLREQVDAATLMRHMNRLFPDAYADLNATLIGITPVDLYDQSSHFRYVFGVKRTSADPKGIISTFRMDPKSYGEPVDDELLFTRARKMFSRYVGLLYYGLATNSEPGSLLYDSILGLSDLDNMTEPLPVPQPTSQTEP